MDSDKLTRRAFSALALPFVALAQNAGSLTTPKGRKMQADDMGNFMSKGGCSYGLTHSNFTVTASSSGATAVAFDGTSIWDVISQPVGDSVADALAKVNVVSGAVTPYSGPGQADGICFDGTDLWVNFAQAAPNTAADKIRPSDGSVLATVTYLTGYNGQSVWMHAFGAWIFTVDQLTGNLIRVVVATGAVASYTIAGSVLCGPVADDGTNLWVLDQGQNVVFVMSPSTGAILHTYTVGAGGGGGISVCFDGLNVWVAISNAAVSGTNALFKLSSSGGVLLTISLASAPNCVAFDGTYIWCYTNRMAIYMLNGTLLIASTTGYDPAYSMAFDGVNMWSQAFTDQSVIRWTLACH